MRRHVTERNTLFTALTTNQHFQETLFPLLDHFRQQQQCENSPSDRVPSPTGPVLFAPTDGTLTSLTETTEYVDDTLQVPSYGSPQTVEIHSPSPNTVPHSFYTANEDLLGSPFNPIDIHLLPEHLVHLTGRQRSRSALAPRHCQTCKRHGHVSTTCIWDGPLECGYCTEIGHGRNNCSTLRRDMARYNPRYNFCMLCSQPGHTLVHCGSLPHQQ